MMHLTTVPDRTPDRRARAFTLIELLAVVVVLAVLVGVGLPRFIDYGRKAARSAEDAIAGAVRTGIQVEFLYRAGTESDPQWLAALDGTGQGEIASGTNPFFVEVLEVPVTDQWTTHATICHSYVGPTGRRYTYIPAQGQFRLRVDFNGDSGVGFGDWVALGSLFGCAVGSGDPNCDAADLDVDGDVDVDDRSIMMKQFGFFYPLCP
jgi:prepilin-type N-terminal cleavage/methylation domain-containing protein